MTAPASARDGMRWLHEILAFLLEVAALIALGYWGLVTGTALVNTVIVTRARRRDPQLSPGS